MGRTNNDGRAAARLRVVGGLFILLLVLGYAAYLVASVYARTRPLPGPVPASGARAYESVTIASCDDTTLAGWYAPGENGTAIILLHDEGGTRADVVEEATLLAEAGYSVLLYDRRGHGESSAVLRAAGWDDLGDVYNAWDWVAARPEIKDGQIGIYGKGLGGQVALRAAAFSRRIFAVAATDPGVATEADRPASLAAGPMSLHERLLFAGISRRTGIPAPFPVVDVIQDIAPRPVLLLAQGEGDREVARNYFERAQEPKFISVGADGPALATFFDDARTGAGLARQ